MNNWKADLNKAKLAKRDTTHSYHKYFGKILPAIAEWAISEFSSEGDLVYDPFTGSGTVGLEAKLNKRRFVGTEINPVSFNIAIAKTNGFSEKIFNEKLLLVLNDYKPRETPPFVYNADHWFDKANLMEIGGVVDSINKNVKGKYKNLMMSLTTSLIRNVSYADPSHVFPGKSKRMVKKIEDGYIAPSFFGAFRKKGINLPKKFPSIFSKGYGANIFNATASDISKKIDSGSVKLIVTNPPYISSIRYEEATKLELYASEIVKSQKEFLDFGKKFTGTEKHGKSKHVSESEYIKKYKTKLNEKNYNTINRFFISMEDIIKSWNTVLLINGKVVIKIGDSVLSKTKIPTGKILTEIATAYGFEELKTFKDKIGSRSFSKYRNVYSGIIIYDNIIILEKVRDV